IGVDHLHLPPLQDGERGRDGFDEGMTMVPPPLINKTSPPPVPGRNFQRMARGSWLAAIISTSIILFNMVIGSLRGGPGSQVWASLALVFIGGGVVSGIVALYGIPRYGKKRILWPALAGIGVNVPLTVLGSLHLLFILITPHAHLKPVVHSPSARLLRNAPLHFSIETPEGFRECPDVAKTPANQS